VTLPHRISLAGESRPGTRQRKEIQQQKPHRWFTPERLFHQFCLFAQVSQVLLDRLHLKF
jgi:hypothetical protein